MTHYATHGYAAKTTAAFPFLPRSKRYRTIFRGNIADNERTSVRSSPLISSQKTLRKGLGVKSGEYSPLNFCVFRNKKTDPSGRQSQYSTKNSHNIPQKTQNIGSTTSGTGSNYLYLFSYKGRKVILEIFKYVTPPQKPNVCSPWGGGAGYEATIR